MASATARLSDAAPLPRTARAAQYTAAASAAPRPPSCAGCLAQLHSAPSAASRLPPLMPPPSAARPAPSASFPAAPAAAHPAPPEQLLPRRLRGPPR